MSALIQDLRYAVRSLTRRPLFAGVVVVTLALGIGANTAIFSVVRGVLLRELPFESPDRLVRLHSEADGGLSTVSPPDFTDWRREATSFESMTAFHRTSLTLGDVDLPVELPAERVTPGFFATLGVPPARGRGFRPVEGTPGEDRVAVLSHATWQTRFGGDPRLVGRSVRLDGEPYRVVGIASPDFAFPAGVAAWIPLAFTPDDLTTQRGAHYLDVVARLAPGVRLPAARAEMAAIGARLATRYPDTNAGQGVRVTDLRESIVGDARPALLVLLGAVGLVLLVACANVANLFLGRTLGRRRELALRAALGAGRGGLVRGILVEALVLALAGGLAGLLLAVWGTDLLLGLQAADLPRVDEVGIDRVVLAFTLGLTLAAGALVGLVPALRVSGETDLRARLAGGGRGQTERGRDRRTRNALVVAEVALAVVLVAGAGLLTRSFARLVAVDPGFRTERVLLFDLSLPDARYPEPADARRFYDELTGRLEALPGVREVGGVFGLPLTGFQYIISVEELDGAPAYDRPGEERSVEVRVVTPGYFAAMGIPLLSGRGLEAADAAGTPPVAVVSRTAARLLWGDRDPVGRSVEVGTSLGLGGPRAGGRVVGVAGDVRHFGLAHDAPPQIYVAHAQFPVSFLTLAVHTSGDPGGLVTTARRVVADLDPGLAVDDLRTGRELVAGSVSGRRFYLVLLGLFGGCALLLALVGVYGLVSFTVRRRTPELGLRMALGAAPGDVLRLVLGQGARLGGMGLLLGLGGALALTRFLQGFLYGVSPTDPVTLATVSGLLGACVVAASLGPARRAARVDPLTTLRHE